MARLQVAIIGGGIIGLSSAIRALEVIPDAEVTIIAEKFTPHTTGDGSAGFWNPYLLGSVDPQKLRYWCEETFRYLLNICTSPEASYCGVGLLSAYALAENPIEDPPQASVFLQRRDMNRKELELFPKKYRYGKFYTTLFAECAKLLPYMMERLKENGVKVIQRKVDSLNELIGIYDVVINCPGVQARNLVGDTEVFPIRGQTIRVYAPWIKNAVVAGEFHILPNSEAVVCGGTHQKGDWNTAVDPADRDRIFKGCVELVPSLKDARIVKEWVGLRPGRCAPRIERETMCNELGQTLEVIHNYGHGGSGVTLFWGCAKDAADLLKQYVHNAKSSGSFTSKL